MLEDAIQRSSRLDIEITQYHVIHKKHCPFTGESLLHILIICDTLVHTRIARILIKCFPRSAIDKIEGMEYLGATGLHLSIAYGNDEVAQAILENGVNIHQRAMGLNHMSKLLRLF